MQDVLKEVGLSGGAVHRCFPGKEDITEDITAETFAAIRDAFEEARRMSPPPAPDVPLSTVLGRVLSGELYRAGAPDLRRPSPCSSGPRRCATGPARRSWTRGTPRCAPGGPGRSRSAGTPGSRAATWWPALRRGR
ncbi:MULTISPECIES: hypothetical protein [Streptomyces]|uniref:TetR/AcrR family transcriptional regulator n=1 Tax=Streptomyces TaxID=1883 RepID=UPI001EF40E1F|nr:MULTISPECIES: hypothetical protein [Streptomyces]